MRVHGIICTYLGDGELDIGKTARWLQYFTDSIFFYDANPTSDARKYVIDYAKSFADCQFAYHASTPFQKDPTVMRRMSFAAADAAWRYDSGDWVIWMDGTEGLSTDSPLESLEWWPGTEKFRYLYDEAFEADQPYLGLPFRVFLNQGAITEHDYLIDPALGDQPSNHAVWWSCDPKYLSDTAAPSPRSLLRMARVDWLRSPLLPERWAAMDTFNHMDYPMALHASIISYAYARYSEVDYHDPSLWVEENDIGFTNRLFMQQVPGRNVPELPIAYDTPDPVGFDIIVPPGPARILVRANPTNMFTFDFTGHVTKESGNESYSWDWGDGTPDETGQTVEHVFPSFLGSGPGVTWCDDFERSDGPLGANWLPGHIRADPSGSPTYHVVTQTPSIVGGAVEGVEDIPTNYTEILINDAMLAALTGDDQFIEIVVADYHQAWNTSEQYQVVEGGFDLYCQASTDNLAFTGVDCEFFISSPTDAQLWGYVFQQDAVGANVDIGQPEGSIDGMGWPDNSPKTLRLEVSAAGHVRFLCEGTVMIEADVPALAGDRVGFGFRWHHTGYGVPGSTGDQGGSFRVLSVCTSTPPAPATGVYVVTMTVDDPDVGTPRVATVHIAPNMANPITPQPPDPTPSPPGTRMLSGPYCYYINQALGEYVMRFAALWRMHPRDGVWWQDSTLGPVPLDPITGDPVVDPAVWNNQQPQPRGATPSPSNQTGAGV